MSSRLTRRTFFALPVALPVAAVAAKVEAVVPAPKRWVVVGAKEVHCGSRPEYEAIRQQIIALFDDIQRSGRPWIVGIDAGGSDDKVAVAVVQSAQPVEA